MQEQLQKEIDSLKARVAELESFANEKKAQQITLPVDIASIDTLAQALQDAGYVIT